MKFFPSKGRLRVVLLVTTLVVGGRLIIIIYSNRIIQRDNARKIRPPSPSQPEPVTSISSETVTTTSIVVTKKQIEIGDSTGTSSSIPNNQTAIGTATSTSSAPVLSNKVIFHIGPHKTG